MLGAWLSMDLSPCLAEHRASVHEVVNERRIIAILLNPNEIAICNISKSSTIVVDLYIPVYRSYYLGRGVITACYYILKP